MPEKKRECLVNAEELLYRQVHPSWYRDGRPSSQAFIPTPKDHDLLSTARESMTTAEAAFRLHTEGRKLKSVGTWGVTVAECRIVELTAYHDPTTSPPDVVADPAHASVDFSVLASNKKKDAAGAWLARLAKERGCLYTPAGGVLAPAPPLPK